MYIIFNILLVIACALTAWVCAAGNLSAAIFIACGIIIVFILNLYLRAYFEKSELQAVYDQAGAFRSEVDCNIAGYDPPQTQIKFFQNGFVFDDNRFPLTIYSYNDLQVSAHVMTLRMQDDNTLRLICQDKQKLAVINSLKETFSK